MLFNVQLYQDNKIHRMSPHHHNIFIYASQRAGYPMKYEPGRVLLCFHRKILNEIYLY